MNILNRTPHPLELHTVDGKIWTVMPSGEVARCTTEERELGNITFGTNEFNEVLIVEESFGTVIDLPEEGEYPDTAIVVSSIVAAALTGTGRKDIYVPTRLMRDNEGRITGAGALRHVNCD